MNELSDADRRIIRIHLDHFDRSGATPVSLRHRRDNLHRLARSLPCDLLDATPDLLDQWQSGLLRRRTRRGSELARSTISTYTTHTNGFYRWAFDAGHLEVNPAARLPRIRLSRGVPHPIPEADLQSAILCADARVRTWLLLAAFMGLRAMEIAQLRRDSFTEQDGRLLLSAVGKGRKPFTMVVPKHIEANVRQWLATDTFLWKTQTGAAVTPTYVSRVVGDFFRRLGQPYTLHWARHSFGTAAYAQTRDLLLTQDLMRHASPETTRIYVQTGGKAGVRALDKLAARVLRRKDRRPRPPAGGTEAAA